MCVRVETVGHTTILSLRKLQLESNTVALRGFVCVYVRRALRRYWGEEGDLLCPGVPRLILTLKGHIGPKIDDLGEQRSVGGRHGCEEGEE